MSASVPLGGGANALESIGDFNEEKIAIYTMDDFSSILRTAINKFDGLRVYILTCAINTNLKTQWVNSTINRFSNFRHQKTTTTKLTNRSTVNRKGATILFF